MTTPHSHGEDPAVAHRARFAAELAVFASDLRTLRIGRATPLSR